MTIKRKKPVRKRNGKRAKQRYQRAYGGKKADWIRSLGCVFWMSPNWFDYIECEGGTHAHHAKSRGAGGYSVHLVPLCARHHHKAHTMGRESFEKFYCVDLQGVAAELEAEWQLLQEKSTPEELNQQEAA